MHLNGGGKAWFPPPRPKQGTGQKAPQVARVTAYRHGSSKTEGRGAGRDEGTVRRPPPCLGWNRGPDWALARAEGHFPPLTRPSPAVCRACGPMCTPLSELLERRPESHISEALFPAVAQAWADAFVCRRGRTQGPLGTPREGQTGRAPLPVPPPCLWIRRHLGWLCEKSLSSIFNSYTCHLSTIYVINLPVNCTYIYRSINDLLIYLLVVEGGGAWAALCYRSGAVVSQAWPRDRHPQHPWELSENQSPAGAQTSPQVALLRKLR